MCGPECPQKHLEPLNILVPEGPGQIKKRSVTYLKGRHGFVVEPNGVPPGGPTGEAKPSPSIKEPDPENKNDRTIGIWSRSL